MRASASPAGLALLLIVVGLMVCFTSVTAAFVTREPVWHYLITGGCVLQIVGWVAHGRRNGSTR
ncbi:hypothetical protein [Streptomyces sp. WMMC905]|uniref:hypothetical protein n=1 Tax=Streptomyces sp. WMMC905 TaxID=3404123 RepID=UPI003B9351DC